MASGYNTASTPTSRGSQPSNITATIFFFTAMSKDNIQDVVRKSLEKYFRDLGEQQPTNVYEMVLFTVERPILEVVMARAEGNQSLAAEMLGINRNTLRKKLQQHGLA